MRNNTNSEVKLYHLATFGCQMNVYDSNLIATLLERRGLSMTREPKKADLIVVNTCSVRGGAEERAYARIASMRYYKKRKPRLKIAVVGCMAQNHKEKIIETLEHVDFVIGPDNYSRLDELVLSADNRHDNVLTGQNSKVNYHGVHARLDSPVSTNIAVMRGCNMRCAYCIVPSVRGKERSRSPQEIKSEIVSAVSNSISEVVLLGQTVNSYRYNNVKFPELLRVLNDIKNLKRIRFTSPHPKYCTPDFIKAMTDCDKVCKHLHLPVQSGSDKILKNMRRMYTRRQFLDVIDSLRQSIPQIGLTTDIITGYTGETQKDFEDTLSLVKQVQFDSAFMFSFSPREGTEAYGIKETLTEADKGKRLRALIDLQNGITSKKIQAMNGRTVEVLLEGPSRKDKYAWAGKTSCFKTAVLPADKLYRPGAIVEAQISGVKGNTLLGSAIKS